MPTGIPPVACNEEGNSNSSIVKQLRSVSTAARQPSGKVAPLCSGPLHSAQSHETPSAISASSKTSPAFQLPLRDLTAVHRG